MNSVDTMKERVDTHIIHHHPLPKGKKKLEKNVYLFHLFWNAHEESLVVQVEDLGSDQNIPSHEKHMMYNHLNL